MSSKNNAQWNFTTINPDKTRHYAVFCTERASKSKGLIKIAQKKVPTDHRLVVVVEDHTDEELENAYQQDYCLISLSLLNDYGQEMLKLREIEAEVYKETQKESKLNVDKPRSTDSFIDEVIQKDETL